MKKKERAVEKIYCSFILPKYHSQSAQIDIGAANDKQASYQRMRILRQSVMLL